MRTSLFFLLAFVCLALLHPHVLFAAEKTFSREKMSSSYASEPSAQTHLDEGKGFYEQNRYQEALKHFNVIRHSFSDSPFYGEALFYSGLCLFEFGEYQSANKFFSDYLALPDNGVHFEEVFHLKLAMAHAYRQGKRKHLLGWKIMPKWSASHEEALDLYEEVIVAMSGFDIAAEALFGKSEILQRTKSFEESTKTLQTLIHQFPKHPLSARAFVAISHNYCSLSRLDVQNPDLIGLAQVNADYFSQTFPGDERIIEVGKMIDSIKEGYATSLYETGRFYERKRKPHASLVYYNETIRKFPETKAAQASKERIAACQK